MTDESFAVKEGEFHSSARQQKHRHDLIDAWLQLSGQAWSCILEVGCGQGDQTASLAKRFAQSRITAIDPASPEYGSPTTLGQSQAALKATSWGQNITFEQMDAVSFAARSKSGKAEKQDIAVLSHCIWYFPSLQILTDTFQALKSMGTRHLALAEWDISTSAMSASVHLHSVLLQALPAALRDTEANIRCPLTPNAIRDAAGKAGWKVRGEITVKSPDLEDAQWEVYAAKAAIAKMKKSQLKNEDQIALDAHEAALQAAISHWEASRRSTDSLTPCLDVWVSVFE
ncbi:hypothetical protein CBOM_01564 [Ceraceosorus bombacis]|uniref:Uncharacterized protein n=1 Tax=Ceraceosorus bombacis TaxID=401625 RepID=A0A0P1BCR2_9BASI|nr:hypothetical protein CBOM_01564 [Ceraceosorus bombacis]